MIGALFVRRGPMRLDNLENDEVFSAAIKGLPKVVQLIAVVSEEKRSHALAVARQAYLRTARELGYEESDAQQWASMVMSLLEIAAATSELATANMAAINETKRISTMMRSKISTVRDQFEQERSQSES